MFRGSIGSSAAIHPGDFRKLLRSFRNMWEGLLLRSFPHVSSWDFALFVWRCECLGEVLENMCHRRLLVVNTLSRGMLLQSGGYRRKCCFSWHAFLSCVLLGRGSEIATTRMLCPLVLCFPEYSPEASFQDQHGRRVSSTSIVVPFTAALSSGSQPSRTPSISLHYRQECAIPSLGSHQRKGQGIFRSRHAENTPP